MRSKPLDKAINFALAVAIVDGFNPGHVAADCPGTGCEMPPCCNGDVNADGGINLADPIYVLMHLFLGGPAPLDFGFFFDRCPLPATGQWQCYDDLDKLSPCSAANVPPGQDGLYRKGCNVHSRFIDNKDGTVTDRCTSLMWQKAPADMNSNGVLDDSDKEFWKPALPKIESLILCKDKTWATSPGQAAQHGGSKYDDWRVPNVRELLSIVDYGRHQPALDPVFIMGMGRYFDFFWTSTTFVPMPSMALGVDFIGGSVVMDSKFRHGFHLRAVRNAEAEASASGPCCNGDVNADGSLNLADAISILQHLFSGGLPPVPVDPIELMPVCTLPATGQQKCYDEQGNVVSCSSGAPGGQDGFYQSGCSLSGRFVTHGDGTVSDTCTNLMWKQDTLDVNGNGSIDGGDACEWSKALTSCEDAILCGDGTWTADWSTALKHGGVKYDDWRLPSIRELESILDYSTCTNNALPFDTAGTYWSSTTQLGYEEYAFAVLDNSPVGSGSSLVSLVRKRYYLHVRPVRSVP